MSETNRIKGLFSCLCVVLLKSKDMDKHSNGSAISYNDYQFVIVLNPEITSLASSLPS